MKQITLSIPDESYNTFLNLMKKKFSDIRIKEGDHSEILNTVHEPPSSYVTSLLSEKSLAEEWLSKEDKRWDEVL